MPLQMYRLHHEVAPVHQLQVYLIPRNANKCEGPNGLTLHTGVLRSHNLTVASSPEEMNESSAGLICSDRTLSISHSAHFCVFLDELSKRPDVKRVTGRGKEKSNGYSRIFMPSEIIQILVIMHRVISYRMITFRRGM